MKYIDYFKQLRVARARGRRPKRVWHADLAGVCPISILNDLNQFRYPKLMDTLKMVLSHVGGIFWTDLQEKSILQVGLLDSTPGQCTAWGGRLATQFKLQEAHPLSNMSEGILPSA